MFSGTWENGYGEEDECLFEEVVSVDGDVGGSVRVICCDDCCGCWGLLRSELMSSDGDGNRRCLFTGSVENKVSASVSSTVFWGER